VKGDGFGSIALRINGLIIAVQSLQTIRRPS